MSISLPRFTTLIKGWVRSRDASAGWDDPAQTTSSVFCWADFTDPSPSFSRSLGWLPSSLSFEVPVLSPCAAQVFGH
jgi:hypothetical protein